MSRAKAIEAEKRCVQLNQTISVLNKVFGEMSPFHLYEEQGRIISVSVKVEAEQATYRYVLEKEGSATVKLPYVEATDRFMIDSINRCLFDEMTSSEARYNIRQ